MIDIFAESTNSARTYSAFFEADDDVGWLYLAVNPDGPDSKVIGAVQIMRGPPDFTDSDVDVRWNEDETKAGLFIRSKLYGYFDLNLGRGIPGTYPSKSLEW
jgi:hypothetical protein